jgi:phosphoglycerate kinase
LLCGEEPYTSSGKGSSPAADCVGDDVKKAVDAMEPGCILMLENLRFHIEETKK